MLFHFANDLYHFVGRDLSSFLVSGIFCTFFVCIVAVITPSVGLFS